MEKQLTTKEAAERLGVIPARVRQLILEGLLPAQKFGRDLMIKESDLELVKNRRGRGRPRKNKATPQSKGKKKR